MSTLEIELQDLRERNNELVKKVQYWKMTAAQRENEKLDLMKENNDLRLKLSRLRTGGAAHARKLDAEIQSASKQALTHLVQASSAVTRTVQLAKTYMQDRQELETTLPRWSSISNTPSSEKVHRVLPMLIGGQSIQPVVSLSRTMINGNNLRTNRNLNNSQSHNFSERGPLPMHMLQDLYIPLTRIDANGLPVNSMDVDPEDADLNNSTEDLGLDDSGDQSLHESQNVSDTEQFDETRRLDVVEEEAQETEDEVVQPSPKPRTENPLEGPSWLLDRPSKSRNTKSRVNLEPDSTTECDEPQNSSGVAPASSDHPVSTECERITAAVALACEFSPTVRRRKRTSSPPAARTPHTPHTPNAYSPRPTARRPSNNGRILKVLVSKLRLEEDDASPPKRPSLNNSPTRQEQSLVKRESKNNSLSKKYVRDHSPTGKQEMEDSPVKLSTRRPVRDKSPTRRQSRDKSPSLRLSRDMELLSFDAPSPNGATTSHVIISESTSPVETGGSGEPGVVTHRIIKHDGRGSRDSKHDGRGSRDSKHDGRGSRDTKLDGRGSRDAKHDGRGSQDTKQDDRSSCEIKQDNRGSQDSDSGSGSDIASEGRTRRPRKAITYKEKPLNRKMRR